MDDYKFWLEISDICELLDAHRQSKVILEKLEQLARDRGMQHLTPGEPPQVVHLRKWVRENAIPSKLSWRDVLQTKGKMLGITQAAQAAKELGYRYFVFNGRVVPAYQGCWVYVTVNGHLGSTLQEVGLEDEDDNGVGRPGGDTTASRQ